MHPHQTLHLGLQLGQMLLEGRDCPQASLQASGSGSREGEVRVQVWVRARAPGLGVWVWVRVQVRMGISLDIFTTSAKIICPKITGQSPVQFANPLECDYG